MSARIVDRPVENQAIDDLLSTSSSAPAALVLEGEPGIGKTTLCLHAAHAARERGYCVLSARAAAVESKSVLAYAAVADLVGVVDEGVVADLPGPQRLAVDRVLLRADPDGIATDQRAVAAAFLSIIERLAATKRVLVAVDDLQWLDQSSVQVLAFTSRRIPAQVAILGTVRTGSEGGSAALWLQLPRPDMVRRVRVRPLSMGGLHAMMIDRLGRSFPRPTMVRIHAISGGNPFYALELARAIDDDMPGIDVQLPNSLTELVRARVGTLNADVCEVLLAAACLANPSVELVARAIDTAPGYIAELIGDAEGKGIVRLDGNQIAFTHPLLAKGVYSNTPAAQRRRMHRRLAEIVAQPELHARHLALSATSADPLTLQALDTAAVAARRRGAPAAAAELVDLAIRLGGDTPDRRIRLARHHFEAADPARARTLLEETIAHLPRGTLRAEASSLLALVCLVHDSYMEAAGLLEEALEEAAPDLALRLEIMILLAFALVNAGQLPAAMAAAERAVAEATPLEQPHLLSRALSMRAMLRFMHGDGLDRHILQPAAELDDPQPSVAIAVRPAVQHALLLAWVGQLDQAHDQMLAVRRRCTEYGEESDLLFVAFHSVVIETWRGNFADAALAAEDAMERATQLGGDLALSVALMTRCTIGAYTGNSEEVRRDARDALATCQRSGSLRMADWPTATIGFLEVSLRNYDAAVVTLQPLLTKLAAAPDATEIIAAPFVPDAAEALIQLGRLAEAETLVETVERNGRRLDRAWMLAMGARCRSMLLAAQGDLEAATRAAEHAMTEHARLPMPFERARTQLLLGELQRRRRHKDAATVTLHEALAVFDALPAPRWAARALAALARTNVRPSRTTELTPSEQRVAHFAASGMTNHAIAAALFISPKTVEANLSRIYRKFGIHSRAELGRRMAQPNR